MDDKYDIIENDQIAFEVQIRMSKSGDISLDVDTRGNDYPSLPDVLFTLTVSEDVLLQQYYESLKEAGVGDEV